MDLKTSQAERRIRQIGKQIVLLANELQNCSHTNQFLNTKNDFEKRNLWLDIAQDVYERRKQRRKAIPFDIFGEPAWDILLDLYISEKRNRPISVTSACIASHVPGTTALRCISDLIELGLVKKQKDATDARRSLLNLTKDGKERMTQYFAENFSNLECGNLVDIGSPDIDNFDQLYIEG